LWRSACQKSLPTNRKFAVNDICIFATGSSHALFYSSYHLGEVSPKAWSAELLAKSRAQHLRILRRRMDQPFGVFGDHFYTPTKAPNRGISAPPLCLVSLPFQWCAELGKTLAAPIV